MPRTLGEWAGYMLGWLLSPVVAVVALARRSRMFHPNGVVCQAHVEPATADPILLSLASRLTGDAVVRLSSAWWKNDREWVDDLGVAIRFGGATGSQDLLFATIRRWWSSLFAVFSTNTHDFRKNYYYSVSPFDVRGVGRAKFRLTPVGRRVGRPHDNRMGKLLRAIDEGEAMFLVEIHRGRLNSYRADDHRWEPLVVFQITKRLDVPQAALRFDAFRAGQGIVPRGFIQFLRPGTYRASRVFGAKSRV